MPKFTDLFKSREQKEREKQQLAERTLREKLDTWAKLHNCPAWMGQALADAVKKEQVRRTERELVEDKKKDILAKIRTTHGSVTGNRTLKPGDIALPFKPKALDLTGSKSKTAPAAVKGKGTVSTGAKKSQPAAGKSTVTSQKTAPASKRPAGKKQPAGASMKSSKESSKVPPPTPPKSSKKEAPPPEPEPESEKSSGIDLQSLLDMALAEVEGGGGGPVATSAPEAKAVGQWDPWAPLDKLMARDDTQFSEMETKVNAMKNLALVQSNDGDKKPGNLKRKAKSGCSFNKEVGGLLFSRATGQSEAISDVLR